MPADAFTLEDHSVAFGEDPPARGADRQTAGFALPETPPRTVASFQLSATLAGGTEPSTGTVTCGAFSVAPVTAGSAAKAGPRQVPSSASTSVCVGQRDDMIARIREAIVRVGWSETARRCGIDRVTLHRAFGTTPKVKGPRGPIGPSFDTVLAVLPAVGLKLIIK